MYEETCYSCCARLCWWNPSVWMDVWICCDVTGRNELNLRGWVVMPTEYWHCTRPSASYLKRVSPIFLLVLLVRSVVVARLTFPRALFSSRDRHYKKSWNEFRKNSPHSWLWGVFLIFRIFSMWKSTCSRLLFLVIFNGFSFDPVCIAYDARISVPTKVGQGNEETVELSSKNIFPSEKEP